MGVMICVGVLAVAAVFAVGDEPDDSRRPPGLPPPGSYLEVVDGSEISLVPWPGKTPVVPFIESDPRCYRVPSPLSGDPRPAYRCDDA